MATTIAITTEGLTDRAARAIAEIAQKRGPDRPLALADLDDIRAAIAQGEAAYAGTDDEDSDADAAAHLPMSIGIPGAVLHRPNYAARIRLIQADAWPIPARWTAYPAEWCNLVAGFVLAHAYDRDAIAAIGSADQAQAVIEAWAAGLQATCSEVAEAVAKLTAGAYPPVENDPGEKKKPGPGSGREPSPVSCAIWLRALGVLPATGSGTSRKPTSAGRFARFAGAAASRRRLPGAEARRSTRRTHDARPSGAGVN